MTNFGGRKLKIYAMMPLKGRVKYGKGAKWHTRREHREGVASVRHSGFNFGTSGRG